MNDNNDNELVYDYYIGQMLVEYLYYKGGVSLPQLIFLLGAHIKTLAGLANPNSSIYFPLIFSVNFPINFFY